ncbi:MAG: hypothetical protein EOM90_11590 [Alphaproteobacteria bacterium]|nr:hypothetical protein [Alphaproteobacteria bacterium]
MKLRLILITLMQVALMCSLNAQDRIVLINNDTIIAKVISVGSTISYKKFNFTDGPTYELSKKDINKIIYQNGVTENYSNLKKPRIKKRRPSFIEMTFGDAILISKPNNSYDKKAGYQFDINGAWFFAHNVGIGIDYGIGIYPFQYTITNASFGVFWNIPFSKTTSLKGKIMGGMYSTDNGFDGGKKTAPGVNVGIGTRFIVIKHFGINVNIDYHYTETNMPVEFYFESINLKYTFQPIVVSVGFSYVF